MKQFIWGAAFGAACTLAMAAVAADLPAAYKDIDRFAEAFQRVRANYIHEIGTAELIDKAISGLMHELDPHSTYLNAKHLPDMQVQTASAGVGIEAEMVNDNLIVVAPIAGAAAALGGIKPDDHIISIDGMITHRLPLEKSIDMLRGPDKSQVTLVVARTGEPRPLTFVLTRGFTPALKVEFEAKRDIAYIRIHSFAEGIDREVERAARTLKRQMGKTLKGYILDLRNNGGGLLDQAIQVSDSFLVSGTIASTRGRHPEDTTKYDASGGDIADGKPIIVLVNRGTASGAEIMAGALQDNRRATILGMRTYGAGTVRTVIPLVAGGALVLTTALFYTPAGHQIQVQGIIPDIAVAQGAEDNPNAASEAKQPGHIAGESQAARAEPDILRPGANQTYQDFQLYTAIARMNAMAPARP